MGLACFLSGWLEDWNCLSDEWMNELGWKGGKGEKRRWGERGR